MVKKRKIVYTKPKKRHYKRKPKNVDKHYAWKESQAKAREHFGACAKKHGKIPEGKDTKSGCHKDKIDRPSAEQVRKKRNATRAKRRRLLKAEHRVRHAPGAAEKRKHAYKELRAIYKRR